MTSIKTLSLGVAIVIGAGVTAFGQDQTQPVQPRQGQSSSLDQAQQDPQPGQQPSSQQTPSPGWRRFGDSGPADSSQAGPSRMQSAPPPQQQQQFAQPSSLTVPAGTWVTVRVNQLLSTDRNQAGDAFTASLVEPVISQGLVVARRGQTVGGRVTDSMKAGRVKGTSQLGVELTELSLVDGQQMPLKTQFVERRGDTSVGRDVGSIGATTGIGAAIGAAAGGGLGAGIGAAAGLVVSSAGVLVTRGRPTVIYPEMVLTFRLEQPLTITSQNMSAFQVPSQQDYNSRPAAVRSNVAPRPYGAPYPAYPAPYYYGTGYGYGYPYAYGPSLYIGPSYYGRGFYGRRW